MNHSTLIKKLLNSTEPSVRWKIKVNVLDQDRESPEIKALEKEIRNSPRIRAILQKVDESGILRNERNVYDKWQGTHWVLMTLADMGYPQGDDSLYPLADEVLKTWLQRCYLNDNIAKKKPDARKSTFIHTLYSMRALALYAKQTGDAESKNSALRASEVLLKRRLYKRISDGEIIKSQFVKLHYSLCWHYDILGALKVFAEIDLTEDKCFRDVLVLLEEKELLSGVGQPKDATIRKYRVILA